MQAYLLVAVGSALGGAGRYWCAQWFAERFGDAFPWGTVFINILGSFLIGVVGALGDPQASLYLSANTRLLLMVGVLGGFTTFSAFSLQTLNLLRAGELAYAAANVLASVVLCIVAVWLGFLVATSLSRVP